MRILAKMPDNMLRMMLGRMLEMMLRILLARMSLLISIGFDRMIEARS